MPIIIPKNQPSNSVLKTKGVFVMTAQRAQHQDIRPLRIGILNIMPLKEDTETQFFRMIGNTPLQVHPILIKTETYTPKNTPATHLKQFYKTFDEVKAKGLDGLIITGANVELLDFEQVDYWQELTEILIWARQNVTSTLGVCWGAQAGLFFYYGIKKRLLATKEFGVFRQTHQGNSKLLRGMDDSFTCPISRETENSRAEIASHPELEILVESSETGPAIVASKDYKFIAVSSHFEYDRGMLAREWIRDKILGKNTPLPKNYFFDEKVVSTLLAKDQTQILELLSKLPSDLKIELFSLKYFPATSTIHEQFQKLLIKNKGQTVDPAIVKAITPVLSWRANAEVFYRNWVNYVYQVTPYHL